MAWLKGRAAPSALRFPLTTPPPLHVVQHTRASQLAYQSAATRRCKVKSVPPAPAGEHASTANWRVRMSQSLYTILMNLHLSLHIHYPYLPTYLPSSLPT